MALTEKNYVTNGTQQWFSFDFPYLNNSDVQVELNGTRLTPIEEATNSVAHEYTRHTTQIRILSGAPASGSKLRIYRVTNDGNLFSSFYPGSAIRAGDLNDNFTQNLFSTQENTNNANNALAATRQWDATLDGGNGDWQTAFAQANEAKAASTAAVADAATAVSDATAATTAAGNAVTAANQAQADATAASGVATQAQTDATAASGVAAQAQADATAAGNPATAASNPATTASGVATQAQADAAAAVSTANQAQTDATAASNTANAADTKADTAIAAVGNVLSYTPRTTKTTFEATTFDSSTTHEAWEISDSSGITSSYTSFTDNGGTGTAKTVTGVPTNFIGDSGLTARFTYDHANNAFTWSSYWVNDAEERYVFKADTSATVPSGTTAQRPSTPAVGMFRYNTTENEFEGYDGSWGKIGGGLVTIDAGNFDTGFSLVSTTETYDGGEFT